LYELSKVVFNNAVQDIIHGIASFDNTISALVPNDCTFRIYRDIRFSHDKTPYKPNMGAYMAKGGRKSKYAGYYFHIEPNNSFLAGGLYIPEADILKKVRTAIMDNIDEFLQIINEPEFVKYFTEVDGEKLKNVPKGFPKDWQYAEFLKLKSFNLMYYITNEQLMQADAKTFVLSIFQKMYKFNHFLNQIIDS